MKFVPLGGLLLALAPLAAQQGEGRVVWSQEIGRIESSDSRARQELKDR
jgi:hypothetical protein